MIIPETYELIYTEPVAEIGATAYMLHHKKTQAKVLLMDTKDDNKVFCIAFRTTPDNSEGTPHIMEHSVLCGSDKYPVKDPFIELAKGSLNTFLNAITWPDKTAYPVASQNEADFRNLMDVYLDAVFHPNIYKTDKILKQEGWHYELTDREGELILNGVVYNEMRGAYSDPDRAVEEKMTRSLFKNTTYAVDSGGDPKHIPELTEEKFLAFHKRYYHPSNSYIYLYGNCDFTERLNYIDSEYLSKYERISPDSEVTLSADKDEVETVRDTFAVSADDDDTKCIFSLQKRVDGLFDPIRYLAYQVLGNVLLNMPGAPIKEALLKAGLCTDVYGGYDSSYRQPVFSVTAKNAEEEKLPEFRKTVEQVISAEIRKGISKKAILAAINNIEFSMREADFGSTPRGLVYWMGMMETWLHDETKALIHLKYDASFKELRALSETDYFERLCENGILNNTNGVLICLAPEKGRTEAEDRALSEKLAAYKATLSEAELDRIIAETAELKAYQSEPCTEEALEKIPLLSLDEIDREPKPYKNEAREIAGITTVFHDIVTSGIGYLDVYFPLTSVPLSDFPYVTLLSGIYTVMDTARHAYGDLANEISFYTGGIGASTDISPKRSHAENPSEYMVLSMRYLRENAGEAMALFREVFGETKFDDTGRLHEILSEIRTGVKETLENDGHRTAMRRVASYSTAVAYEDERLSGIEYYRLLNKLDTEFETEKDALVRKLYEVQAKIFKRDGMLISFTGEEADYEEVKKVLPTFIETVPDRALPAAARDFEFEAKNEGVKTSALVQYVAAGGNFYTACGTRPSLGVLDVLRTIMSYEYLWTNIRVKGGAYGCMMNYGRDGKLVFCSYRDPKLTETLDVYRGIPSYLRTLELSERDRVKYIIGTIGAIDSPMLPPREGRFSMSAWIFGSDEEKRRERRMKTLSCSISDLRALADPIEAVLREGNLACVGNENVLSAHPDTFKALTSL